MTSKTCSKDQIYRVQREKSRKRKQSDSAEETHRKLNSKLTIADRNVACRFNSTGEILFILAI